MPNVSDVLKSQAEILLDEALREPRVPYRTFTDHDGLLDTLAEVNAEQASIVHSPDDPTSTIAAHCEHLRFSALVWSDWLSGSRDEVDWSRSWTVSRVSDAEWRALLASLRDAFATLRETMAACAATSPEEIGGIISLLAHTAYHIGSIRQKVSWV